MNILKTVSSAYPTGSGARYDRQQIDEQLRGKLVDEVECGLIVCDSRGLVRFANRAAVQELTSARMLYRRDEDLRCVGSGGAALDAALRVTAIKGRRQLLTLTHQGDRLMVSLIPFTVDACAEPLVLIVLGRRGPCSALGLEMLSGVHGLTLTERRVLAGLMSEAAPRQIAVDQGVALSTVRSHISAIRSKMGVRTIEALLIRVAEVPQVPPALRFGGASEAQAALNERGASLAQAA